MFKFEQIGLMNMLLVLTTITVLLRGFLYLLQPWMIKENDKIEVGFWGRRSNVIICYCCPRTEFKERCMVEEVCRT